MTVTKSWVRSGIIYSVGLRAETTSLIDKDGDLCMEIGANLPGRPRHFPYGTASCHLHYVVPENDTTSGNHTRAACRSHASPVQGQEEHPV